MINAQANRHSIEINQANEIVIGSAGVRMSMTFDDFWREKDIVVAFSNGYVERRLLVTGDASAGAVELEIPSEVLREAGFLYVGVIGTDDEERQKIKWTKLCKIVNGPRESPDEAEEATPSVVSQILRLANSSDASARQAVGAAQTAAQAAQTAQLAAQTAAEDAREGSEAAQGAAEDAATEAQSYAKGGTESRTGEDTDNAKYYMEQTQALVNRLKTLYYGDIQRIVRQGLADSVFAIGDQITVDRSGTALVFDVIGIDYDVPADGIHTHSMTLCLHDCLPPIQWDAREAMCCCETGLAAGTYHFSLPSSYEVVDGGGKTLQFTLTQPVPEGGQIVTAWEPGVQSTTATISTFASAEATEPIESNIPVIEGRGGSDLGTVPDGVVTGNLNDVTRMRFGSNNWVCSGIRQWLNSDAASGWWSPQTVFDRPISTPTEGFLYGLDSAFVACLGTVRKRTVLCTTTDGGGYVDTDELIFLPSKTEMCGHIDGGVYETPVTADGAKTTRYPQFMRQRDRRKYLSGNPCIWWTRSGYATNPCNVCFTEVDGTQDGIQQPFIPEAAAPCMCIV